MEMRPFTPRCVLNHTLNPICLSTYHKATESYYQRLPFSIYLINQLFDDNPDRDQLITIVNESVRSVDIRELNTSVALPPIRFMVPTHAKFYDFVASALQKLKDWFSLFPAKTAQIHNFQIYLHNPNKDN
jgi:hypothetical protein